MEELTIERIIHEIDAYMNDEGTLLGFPSIVDKPNGEKQMCEIEIFDHEYVDQHTGFCSDDYFGTMAFPLPSGKYIEISYQM